MKRRVLVLNTNGELLRLRVAVLRSEGFQVDMAESKEQTLELLGAHNYDAMVICWSISGKSAAEYSGLFRQRNAQGCLVYVGTNPWHRPTTIQADTFVSGAEGPDVLIEAVQCGSGAN